MGNRTNLGLFTVHKIVSEYAESIQTYHAKRIYDYINKRILLIYQEMQNWTEGTSPLIMALQEYFLRSFISALGGFKYAKNPFHAIFPLNLYVTFLVIIRLFLMLLIIPR